MTSLPRSLRPATVALATALLAACASTGGLQPAAEPRPIDDHVLTRSLSGAPLKRRSLEVLQRIRARSGDHLTLIAAGGIENADDARERLDAGATLVQAYTAFIYEGPFWPRRVHAGLARSAKA